MREQNIPYSATLEEIAIPTIFEHKKRQISEDKPVKGAFVKRQKKQVYVSSGLSFILTLYIKMLFLFCFCQHYCIDIWIYHLNFYLFVTFNLFMWNISLNFLPKTCLIIRPKSK